MSLRNSFRQALVSIAHAIPDAVHTLSHQEWRGEAVKVTSRDYSAGVVDAPETAERFYVNASHFPLLDIGEAVLLDDRLRTVTELHRDAVDATLNIGLSKPFSRVNAIISGVRRSRRFREGVSVLYAENGTAENYQGAIAPTYANAYTIAISVDEWRVENPPEPSDTIDFAPRGYGETLKVSTVTKSNGCYILKCRTKYGG